MTIPANNGYIDLNAQEIIPENTSTWADLSGTTWNSWNSWIPSPATPHYWTSDVLDVGQAAYVNLKITGDAIGTKSYKVHSSLTGAFAGEETTVDIAAGDEGITAFYGRYFRITIGVEYQPGEGLNIIRGLDFTTTNESFEIILTEQNTDNLTGGVNGKTLVLPRVVSHIQTMMITPYIPEPYFTIGYVADDYVQLQSPAYPAIVSKSATEPKVAFVNDSGVYQGSIFDAVLKVLPEMYVTDDGNVDVR
jgi:hypothetical protein